MKEKKTKKGKTTMKKSVKKTKKSKTSNMREKYLQMREKMKEDINKKTERSAQSGDNFKYGNFFKSDIEAKYPLWVAKSGEHTLCILPYMAGDNDPDNRVKEGDFTYTLTLLVHYGVGINEDAVICPRTFGDKCPICEYRKELIKEDGDEDLIRSLQEKKRCIYNVWVFDSDDEIEKGVQIWDSSHYLFQRQLVALAKHPRGGGHIAFASPFDDGYAIVFERVGEGRNTKYEGMKLFPRAELLGSEFKEIPDYILDNVCCLDQAIEVLSYDDIKEKFMSGMATNDNDEGDDIIELNDDEDEDEELDSDEEDTDDDDEIDEDEDFDMDDDIEIEDIDDDDEFDEDEEEEKPKKDECPEGGDFGKDFGEFDECDDCYSYQDCFSKYTEIVKNKKKGKGSKKRTKK